MIPGTGQHVVSDAVMYDAVGEVRLQQLAGIRYDILLLVMLLVKVMTVWRMSIRRRRRSGG